MTQVTRWWLIRHAPTADNDGRIFGHSDVPVSGELDDGVLRPLATSLPQGAVWVITPWQRTRQTADALARAGGFANRQTLSETGLSEQNYGEWERHTWAELQEIDGDHRLDDFWRNPATEVPPGGESFSQVIERTAEAMNRLNTMLAGRDIVAVVHAGTVRAVLAMALGLTSHGALCFRVDPLSLTRLDHLVAPGGGTGVWRIDGVNLLIR